MNKQEFAELLSNYLEAEEAIEKLNELGVDIWSAEKTFYHNYNYIIFKLLSYHFGEENKELIECFLFGEIEISFEELCERIDIYE